MTACALVCAQGIFQLPTCSLLLPLCPESGPLEWRKRRCEFPLLPGVWRADAGIWFWHPGRKRSDLVCVSRCLPVPFDVLREPFMAGSRQLRLTWTLRRQTVPSGKKTCFPWNENILRGPGPWRGRGELRLEGEGSPDDRQLSHNSWQDIPYDTAGGYWTRDWGE